jgi:hypothetical protein
MADSLDDYADLLVHMQRPQEAATFRDRARAIRATILFPSSVEVRTACDRTTAPQ